MHDDASSKRTPRVESVDVLRGFVMLVMIFVNDLAGAGRVVPDALVHFSDRHPGASGMTFVDLVFPAFLFLVGMSVPLGLGGRQGEGQSPWRLMGHVLVRMGSLLGVGILMVHETPDSAALGWSGAWWCVLMYASAMAAFASIAPRGGASTEAAVRRRAVSRGLRVAGLVGLLSLAWVFRGSGGERIVTWAPFSISTQWYGILGLIGWAYGVACVVYLAFARRPMAMLGCQVLLLCLFAADRAGGLNGLPLPRWVGWGDTVGSLGSISVSGLLFGTVVLDPRPERQAERGRFIVLFAAGCALAALLLGPLYGIQKNQATPSWSLWACAITGLMWWGVHHLGEAWPGMTISRCLGWAGRNVLLAYLISEMLPSLIQVLGATEFYGRLAATLPAALVRSAGCAVCVLAAAVALNRGGFRLRL